MEAMPPALSALMDRAQKWLQDAVNKMGVGKPSTVPDFGKLLSDNGIADTEDASTMATQYKAKVDNFRAVKTYLLSQDVDVNVPIGRMAELAQNSLGQMISKIEDLKDVLRAPQNAKDAPTAVQQHPKTIAMGVSDNLTGITMDPATTQYLMGELRACLDKVEKIVKSTSDTAAGFSKQVAPPASPIPPTTPTPSSSPSATPTPPAASGVPIDSTLSGNLADGGPLAISPAPASSDPGATLTAATGAAIQPIEAAAGTSNGTSAGSVAGDSSGSGDMGTTMMMTIGMVMSALPNIAKTLMDAIDSPQDDSRNREHRDRAPAPANAQPVPEPVQATPAVYADPPPATALPVIPPGTTPAPDLKSEPLVRLKDGSTQPVAPVVAAAVLREFNNHSGSDAQAAYTGAAADSASGNPWNSGWTKIDSAQLRTGDVAQWDNRMALVITENGKLYIIVNGEQVELKDPQNPPDGGHGTYGEFRGYFHLTGTDVGVAASPVTNPPPVKPV
ncbi:hypothetical protein [Nocardia sp. NBC_01327]|uniref:hypothetical protein n=1 Tax=Nocardia sp. NBC_01327 TaxID=2903593 RepID=UPI002E0E8BF0|nr:hypothetical protein OG326_41795 [Nocardia sp. NBC_01327]